MSTGRAAAAAAAAQQIANASASFGPCVRVDGREFLRVLSLSESPLVAACESSGWFTGPRYRYLTSYKGLTFYSKSPTPLELPAGVEVVTVGKMSVVNL